MNVYECALVIADGIAETQAVGAAIELQVERVIGTQTVGGSGITDGDKGDITVSASGATWTIDANAVTSTKLADRSVTAAKLFEVGHEKLIGRHGAGAGDAQEIGIDGGLELQGGNLRRSALTGDVTASAGNGVTTLANSGVTANTYGSASAIPVITVDAKGRVTSASTAAFTSGKLVNYWVATTTTTGSTTNILPIDDTIPQSSEGAEFMTVSVTPSSASNKLKVTVSGWYRVSGASVVGCALFVGSASSASASRPLLASNVVVSPFDLVFWIDSFSGTETLRFRMGTDRNTVTFQFLNASGATYFGSTDPGMILVEEYVV